MYRKVKNIKEFRSLLLASLSSQELSIEGSCVKRVCGSQQVGESPSSSEHSTKSEPRKCRKWSDVSFPWESLRAINITTKIPLTLDLLLTKITRLHYSAFHNFKNKCGLRAGVSENMSKIYYCIVLEGKRCVNGFVSWQIIVSIFFLLWHQLQWKETWEGQYVTSTFLCWPQSPTGKWNWW